MAEKIQEHVSLRKKFFSTDPFLPDVTGRKIYFFHAVQTKFLLDPYQCCCEIK